ncbi:MAG: PBECR2 nuclease fold domain-containing protein [Alphaproteobacteria bacterium]
MAGRVDFTPLPPAEALKFFRGKTIGGRVSYAWQDVERAEHAAAFVVAKMMRADLLKDVHSALEAALRDGQTLRQFSANLRPILEQKGWWGFGDVFDPVTGETKLAELGTPRRLATIYDVNLRTARAAGRWERIERQKKTRPYLMYVHAGDGRVRAAHRAWGDRPIILPVDHPFWKTHYPPNGWRCRCIVRQVTARYLTKQGLTVSGEEQLTALGYGKTQPWTNPRTGKTRNVSLGIDAAFDYNAGQSRLKPLTPGSDGGPVAGTPREPNFVPGRTTLPLPPPRAASSNMILPPDVTGELAVQAFLDEFKGALRGSVFFDPAQIPLPITRDLFTDARGKLKVDKRARAQYLPLLAKTLKDPDEIWFYVGKDAAGREEISRLSLARWTLDGEELPGIVIFAQTNTHWRGVTAFPVNQGSDAKRIAYLINRVRLGTLIYQREN